jgi:Superinfection immunity protein
MLAVYVISGIAAALLLMMLLAFVARLGDDSFLESVKQLFGGVLAIPLLIGMAAFYVLPSIIAFFRSHENFVPILIVNLFAGWTMLGWVASLAWSFSSSVKESRQYVRQVVVHETADDRWKEKDG